MVEGATAGNTGLFADPGNDTVTLSASVGLVQDNGNGAWSWSFATNDGPDQSQTVTITATDSDGAQTSATFQLVVNNAPPSLSASQPTVTVVEGATAGNTGLFGDPGNDTVALSASIGAVQDNGNGAWSWSFATNDGPDQSQTVTITATDSDGAQTSTTFQLVVNNAPPSLSASQATVTVLEGATAGNTGVFADPGLDAVVLSASIGAVQDNGNGAWSWSFATNDGPDQSQTVTITATDSDGAQTSTTFQLVVNNAPPSVVIQGAPGLAAVGEAINLMAAVTDPGTGDAHEVLWSVTRDGSAFAAGSGVQFGFIPDVQGAYLVSVNVTDDDGAAASSSQRIVVYSAGAGNVDVTIRRGKATIEGDWRGNALLIQAGSLGTGSLRITGLGGTRVNGQTGSIEIAMPERGLDIDLKSGSDWLYFDGNAAPIVASSLRVETHVGQDSLRLEQVVVRGDATIDLGGQANDVRLSFVTILGELLVDAHSGADRILAEHIDVGQDAAFEGGVGRNEIRLADSTFAQQLRVQTQAGDDAIRGERLQAGGSATIDAGAGDNQVYFADSTFGGPLSLESHSGADVMRLERIRVAGEACIDAGVGDNTIELVDSDLARGLLLDAGSGADVMRLLRTHVRGCMAIDTGAGADQIQLIDDYFAGKVFIDTGAGADRVEIERSHFADCVALRAGAGNDQLRIHDSVFEDNAFLDGDSGDDEIDAGLLGDPNSSGNQFAQGLALCDFERMLT